MDLVLVGIAAATTSGVGAIGGLGGAILLVPILVVSGMAPAEAAPLGLLSVAASSIAAAGPLLAERTVNHRIGVTTELAASAGAILGALASGVAADRALTMVLAVVAVAAAAAGLRRARLRNPPDPRLGEADVGERWGTLAGAYPLTRVDIVPYRVRRLPLGLALTWMSGVVAGLAGVSGGFVRTPAAVEVMTVPVKVAASTTSFAIGITASAGLVVMAVQGRIDTHQGAAVVVGALVGGQLGARLQARMRPLAVRRLLSALLVTVAVVLVVGG